MSIPIKSQAEIETMRRSCKLAGDVLVMIEEHVKPGITTEELDKICHDYIIANNAIPSCLNYKGYPKSTCISINHTVCHGIPDGTRLREGDIVNVDVTTFLDGYHGDNSKTYLVGKTSRAARDITQAAEDAMWAGIRAIRVGGTFGDIGFAIQTFTESKGYSVVREYGGHGIGKVFHEDPHVASFGRKGSGPKILPGMVFTVEPMINQGKREIILLDDDWTVETEDGKLSAQFEHTVAVHENGVEIMTYPSSYTDSRFIEFT